MGALDSLPFVGEAEIEQALSWAPLIDAMEAAMTAFSAGQVNQPVRQMVPVPGRDAIFAAMPAVGAGDAGGMAVKVVTLFHENAGTDLPTHQAVILLFDKSNGTPLAAMDGRLITEMRTAACTAAAARKLAPADARTVAVLGSGVQAEAHWQSISQVREVSDWRIWSRTPANGQALAEKMGASFHAGVADAVDGADIVICATSATEPVLEGAWVRPGAFVASVGWNGADGREMDDAMMANTVIVESRDAARDQAGDIRRSGCEIFAEIGEIYAGDKAVPEGVTVVYDSVGMAIQDVVAADLAWRSIRSD